MSRKSGEIDAQALYAQAGFSYSSGACSFEALITFASRLSLILCSASLPDPGFDFALPEPMLERLNNDRKTSIKEYEPVRVGASNALFDLRSMYDEGPDSLLPGHAQAGQFRRKTDDLQVEQYDESRAHNGIFLFREFSPQRFVRFVSKSRRKELSRNNQNGATRSSGLSSSTRTFSCSNDLRQISYNSYVMNEDIHKLNSTIFPTLSMSNVKLGVRNLPKVHLSLPNKWPVARHINAHMSEYPIEHDFNANLDADKFPITSFVLYTSKTSERNAIVQIYTTFPDIRAGRFDFVLILGFFKRHINRLINLYVSRHMKTETIIIHADNDFTMSKRIVNDYPVSNLIDLELYQNLSVITTVHSEVSANNCAINRTAYPVRPLAVSSSINFVYDVKGFAMSSSQTQIKQIRWEADHLLRQDLLSTNVDLNN